MTQHVEHAHAWALSHAQRRTVALYELTDLDEEPAALAGPADQLEDALEARRALRALAALPERQRRYLTRLASGYSSQEIARVEQASYTNVNKHLRRASDAARPRRSRLTPKGAPPATKRIAPHLKPPAVLGGPDRGHVHVPELVGALDAEEPGALAPPARRPAALQQAVLGHEPACFLAVHRPAQAPGRPGRRPCGSRRPGSRATSRITWSASESGRFARR